MNDILSAEELLSQIKYSLEKKRPLSIVRYGDGEAIMLNGFNDTSSLKMILKRQLGYIPSIDQAEEMRENLIKAYLECDIIGLPVTNEAPKNDQDYWSRAQKLLKENVDMDILNKKSLVSIDTHSHFLDKDYYTQLLTGLDTLNYVSCRDLDKEFKERFGIRVVNKFIISPEVKFDNTYEGDRHYPTQFNQIQKWMDRAINCEGSLCLTGAGVVGKIYNNWFRDRGGVAFDIGSIFDSWTGKCTRGPERGLNAIDNTYKL